MPSAVAINGAGEPLAKRLKLNGSEELETPAKGTRSRIFAPFRVLHIMIGHRSQDTDTTFSLRP